VTSYWPKETWLSVDHGVSRRTFFFNLGYVSCEKPDEYALLHEILSGIEHGGALYGWGDSGENALINAIAPHGLFLQCDPAPNLSFHRAVKPSAARIAPRRARPFDPATVRVAKKHYVAFLLNEGDTLKCMGTMFNGGQWAWPERGRVPINWGSNPWIVEEFPAMMEAYYSTMTEHDLFYSSVTGYGYYSPKHSTATARFAEAERRANPAAGLSTGSVYSVHDMIDACNGVLDPATDAWLVGRGCEGYVFEAAQQASLKFTSALQPLVGADWALFYWRFRFPPGVEPLPAAVVRIRQLAREHEAPSLIPVYAGSPADFKAMADALPADEFEVVLLDEFVELAKQIGQAQLDRDALDLRGAVSRSVTLTLRHWRAAPRSGRIAVACPAGWSVSPASIDYADLRAGESRALEFTVNGPAERTATPARIAFHDSGSGRELGLRVSQSGTPAPRMKPPAAQKILAARGTPHLDGTGRGWGGIASSALDHDLAALGKGHAAARYRWAWDANALYVLIEETRAPATVAECPHGLYFGGGEFKRANGVSFWLDFSGRGTTENGDFAPRFGFSSTGRRDLYTCTLNHRVLVSSRPAAEVFTSGAPGSRIIEARIPWAEIDAMLAEELLPVGGLRAAVRPGYGFGCQPLLIESHEHQAYRNGARPAVDTGAAVTLEAVKVQSGPPTGFDADSLWIELG
nr:NEW3 domain-containing protein [Opitutaceae bacterium]